MIQFEKLQFYAIIVQINAILNFFVVALDWNVIFIISLLTFFFFFSEKVLNRTEQMIVRRSQVWRIG